VLVVVKVGVVVGVVVVKVVGVLLLPVVELIIWAIMADAAPLFPDRQA